MFKTWQAITLWKRVLIGLVFGLVVGLLIRYALPQAEIISVGDAENIGENWIYPFGEAFVRLIKMLIIPLIATTLVSGVTAMGDPQKLGSPGGSHDGPVPGDDLFRRQPGIVDGDLFAARAKASSTRRPMRLRWRPFKERSNRPVKREPLLIDCWPSFLTTR